MAHALASHAGGQIAAYQAGGETRSDSKLREAQAWLATRHHQT